MGLLNPFLLLHLATAAALLHLGLRRREGRRGLLGVAIPFGLLCLIELPVTCHLAVGSLEWRYPPLRSIPTDTQAIVVLGGYAFPPDAVRPRAVLGPDTLDRCLQAVEDLKRAPAVPVVVSGGKVDPEEPGPPLAPLMREFLVTSGVPRSAVIVEDRSRSTYENAVESGKILRERGLSRVVLVTDALYMERAVRCFRKQGLTVTPSGCRYAATTLRLSPSTFLPAPKAAAGLLDALHEWLGLAWYALHGRV